MRRPKPTPFPFVLTADMATNTDPPSVCTPDFQVAVILLICLIVGIFMYFTLVSELMKCQADHIWP